MIDLIPSGRDFRMEIYIDMFDSNQKFVKRKTVKQVFIDDACQTGKTCHCRFTNLALTSQLSTYRGGFECLAASEETQLNIQFYSEQVDNIELSIAIFRGSKVIINAIRFGECHQLRNGLTVATTTTSTTTTTNEFQLQQKDAIVPYLLDDVAVNWPMGNETNVAPMQTNTNVSENVLAGYELQTNAYLPLHLSSRVLLVILFNCFV